MEFQDRQYSLDERRTRDIYHTCLLPRIYNPGFLYVKEIPVLVGSFAMGPIAGVLIELVKIFVHLVTKESMTAGVGDVANFIFGCTFAAMIIFPFNIFKYTLTSLIVFFIYKRIRVSF